MRERNPVTRVDMSYPFDKLDSKGNVLENIKEPPMFEVRFFYHKKGKATSFKIIAQRLDLADETYEIEISGQKRIKTVMK